MHKLKKQRKWYGKTKGAVIFMQATPGECLKKAVQEVCDRSGLRVKVVEKGGRNVRQILQKSDVGCSGKCGREECMICVTQAGGGNCYKEGVGYKIWCTQCDEDGMDILLLCMVKRKSARKRVGEHYEALLKRKDSNL